MEANGVAQFSETVTLRRNEPPFGEMVGVATVGNGVAVGVGVGVGVGVAVGVGVGVAVGVGVGVTVGVGVGLDASIVRIPLPLRD